MQPRLPDRGLMRLTFLCKLIELGRCVLRRLNSDWLSVCALDAARTDTGRDYSTAELTDQIAGCCNCSCSPPPVRMQIERWIERCCRDCTHLLDYLPWAPVTRTPEQTASQAGRQTGRKEAKGSQRGTIKYSPRYCVHSPSIRRQLHLSQTLTNRTSLC